MSDKGDWNPGEKYRLYLDKIETVLSNGEERTVRDIYYALEARGFPSECQSHGYEFEYEYVKRAVKKGRRAGYIHPSQIFDSSRQAVTTSRNGWSNPDDFTENRVEKTEERYWDNFWNYQDTYVEVWLEKQALASVFQPICDEYNVRLEATRGDWSDSKVYEAAQRISEKVSEDKDLEILYFGDFNPSGMHAPVSILDTLEYYGISFSRGFPKSKFPEYYDAEHALPQEYTNHDGTFNVERCALTLEQIDRFTLPENPNPSSSDKDKEIRRHFENYVSEGRDTNVELNALKEFEREFLEELIEEKIEQHIDPKAKQYAEERIEEGKAAINASVSKEGETYSVDLATIRDEFNPGDAP